MKKSTILCSTMVMIVLLSTVSRAEERIVARVNNETITSRDLEEAISSLPPQLRVVVSENSELKKKLIDRLIEEKLLIQEMKREGVKEDEDIKRKVERYKEALLLEKFLKEKFSKISVTDDEIKKYYENNKDEFKKPETYKLSYIFVKDEDKLKKVVNELKNGTSFEKVASLYSDDEETRKNKGFLGEVSIDELSEPYRSVISKLKVGEYSDPIKVENGYQIIRIDEKIPEKIVTLEEVKDKIREKLLSEKQQSALENFIKELKSKSKIEVAE